MIFTRLIYSKKSSSVSLRVPKSPKIVCQDQIFLVYPGSSHSPQPLRVHSLINITKFMASFVVCSAQRVLLPDSNEPTPATIVIDRHSGKIIQVRPGRLTLQEIQLDGNIEWIEAGNNIVLPGLVECVQLQLPYDYLITDIFRYLVPMFISMNRGVQPGRDSGLEPVLQFLEESQPWWTCHSIPYRRPLLFRTLI